MDLLLATAVATMLAFPVCAARLIWTGGSLGEHLAANPLPELRSFGSIPPLVNSVSPNLFLFSSAAASLAGRDPVFARLRRAHRRSWLWFGVWFVCSPLLLGVVSLLTRPGP